MNVTSSGIVNGVIQPQYGGHGTQFNVNGIPTYALRGTIFIQAAHRICKPGQAGGGNGIGGKHILVTETAPYIGRMAKNYRLVFGFPVLDLCLSLHFICLSFPASQNNKKSADKLSDG